MLLIDIDRLFKDLIMAPLDDYKKTSSNLIRNLFRQNISKISHQMESFVFRTQKIRFSMVNLTQYLKDVQLGRVIGKVVHVHETSVQKRIQTTDSAIQVFVIERHRFIATWKVTVLKRRIRQTKIKIVDFTQIPPILVSTFF